jgi:hypothetical protein
LNRRATEFRPKVAFKAAEQFIDIRARRRSIGSLFFHHGRLSQQLARGA